MSVTQEWDLVLLSAVIFVPTLFALALIFFPKDKVEWMRYWSLAGTLVTLVVSIFVFIDFYERVHRHYPEHLRDQGMLGYRADGTLLRAAGEQPALSHDLVVRIPWIQQFNIEYYLGVDGISMPLVLLTTALSFLAMLTSWNIEKNVKGYCMLFLVLETGMIGTFLALDFFLFYIFWEVMLLPMYFLIGVWGGPRKEYAAIKFFLYTLFGSVLILIALLGFYFTDLTPLYKMYQERAVGKPADSTEQRDLLVMEALRQQQQPGPINTFDIIVLQRVGRESAKLEARLQQALEKPGEEANRTAALADQQKYQLFSRGFQLTMFILLFVGFAIKVPIFPFHTWLPDAHVEAPTPISMILAGVLLKLGGYGILRIAYPICPWAGYELAWWIGLLGVINIVYGAFAAMAQTDFKKLVAYSSISHMGYVILGIAVWTSFDRFQYWGWGMNGAMYQMIAHGVTSAGMFFLVGVIYDRAHHRDLNRFGGLNNSMPVYSGISAVIFFGALGLPGLCGFVGEFFTILGTWNFSMVFAILAALTVVITAAYVLWTLQRVYLGDNPKYHGYLEITPRELLCIIPLLVLTVLLGIWPSLILEWMEPSVTGLVKDLASIFASI